MSKIIQFPVQHSNAFNNLIPLISACDNEASLEQYMEVMAVCNEDDQFMNGELSYLLELTRQKMQEFETLQPEVELSPGLYLYWPEMGESKPQCQIEASRSYYGEHYMISTPLQLKGRGIKFERVLETKNLSKRMQYKVGWNEYYVTERAYGLLQKKYSISQECLLD